MIEGLIKRFRKHPLLFFVILEVVVVGIAIGSFVIIDRCFCVS